MLTNQDAQANTYLPFNGTQLRRWRDESEKNAEIKFAFVCTRDAFHPVVMQKKIKYSKKETIEILYLSKKKISCKTKNTGALLQGKKNRARPKVR